MSARVPAAPLPGGATVGALVPAGDTGPGVGIARTARAAATRRAAGVAQRAHTLRRRLEMDFLLDDRLDAYRTLLSTAVAHGYTTCSVERAWHLLRAGTLPERVLVVRNDVDTDPATARALWAVDRELGCTCTYYFRLRTLDVPLIAEMAAHGTEASYHFEEIATVAKRRGLAGRAAVEAHLPEMQDLFVRNLTRLRAETGLAMRTVASHGDFANRVLGVPNWELLVDERFRAEQSIELEVYDRAFMDHVTHRATDLSTSSIFTPFDPLDAFRAGAPFVYLLLHPRQWRANRRVNLAENALRVREGVTYAARRRLSTRTVATS